MAIAGGEGRYTRYDFKHIFDTQGDIGSVCIVLNAVARVIQAISGLYTMMDMPIVMGASG